ncbi:MAG: hypothetical protein LDL23_01860 [Flavobacterium sp.]|uniref:hypothetical protein n=1 Tax=Flavobacterium sp. TaxID=239 RepID=UPI0025B94E1D|nr:hypothetical protein [Flavobacterium sp.]MCA1965375.1 hypothetical protein [Flavobacterium sp.]
MRKFATLLLIASFNLNSFSQEVILDTKLDKLNSSIRYTFNSENELFIMNSNKKTGESPIFNYLRKFESGTFKDILKDEEFIHFFPIPKKNDFMIVNGKLLSKLNYKFYLDAKQPIVKEVKVGEFLNFYKDFDMYKLNDCDIEFKLSDKYIYEIVSKDDKNYKSNNKIEKEDLYLLKFDINTSKTSKVKIDKPNMTRLKNDSLFNHKVIAYLPEMINNDSFQIITKSVEKEGKSSVFYRSIYDMAGKIIQEKSYTIEPIYGAFHYLYNKFTSRNRLNSKNESTTIEPAYDLDINSHFLDKVTGDFYIFGGTQNKNNPLGFYVYKFNKEDKLVWKKYYKVDDPKGFGERNNSYWTTYSLNTIDFSNEELIFVAKGPVNYNDANSHVFKINKNNGDVNTYKKISSTTKSSLGGTSLSRYSLFDNFILSDKKYANLELLIAQELYPEIKKFVSSISDKKGEDKKHIHAKITKNGIFVFETDNESYYKIVKF